VGYSRYHGGSLILSHDAAMAIPSQSHVSCFMFPKYAMVSKEFVLSDAGVMGPVGRVGTPHGLCKPPIHLQHRHNSNTFQNEPVFFFSIYPSLPASLWPWGPASNRNGHQKISLAVKWAQRVRPTTSPSSVSWFSRHCGILCILCRGLQGRYRDSFAFIYVLLLLSDLKIEAADSTKSILSILQSAWHHIIEEHNTCNNVRAGGHSQHLLLCTLCILCETDGPTWLVKTL
jgi:hypothetical protein